MSATADLGDTTMILAFMRTQKEIIESQKTVIESQGAQLEKQNEMIKKLANDCELISKNTISSAKKVADKEIKKFKHAYVKDVADLKARVQDLDNQNNQLKALAAGVTTVAIICIGVAVSPYILVAL